MVFYHNVKFPRTRFAISNPEYKPVIGLNKGNLIFFDRTNTIDDVRIRIKLSGFRRKAYNYIATTIARLLISLHSLSTSSTKELYETKLFSMLSRRTLTKPIVPATSMLSITTVLGSPPKNAGLNIFEILLFIDHCYARLSINPLLVTRKSL